MIKQLKEKTKNGVKVNTMIIDSHGDYNKAKTQIGSTVIRDGNGKNLEELGKFFIDNQKGKIVLLACHAGGNTINNGEKLIVNLSCTTHTTVIGCRSWTGAIGLFGKGLNPSQPNPPRFEDNEGRLAWDFLGQWNMSSNGTSVNTLKMGIQLTSDGSVRRNILSIQPKISKFIKRWVF